MFLSKVLIVLLSAVAAVAIALALVMPKPGERKQQVASQDRLRLGCEVANMWLKANAQQRMLQAGELSNFDKLADILATVKPDDPIPAVANQTARGQLNSKNQGKVVDLIILVDKQGRVVARAGSGDEQWGDSIGGYFVVRDALNGLLGEDIWVIDDKLFLVAASPVISRAGGFRYIGAVVTGKRVTQEFSKELVKSVQLEVGFFEQNADGQATRLVSSAAMSAVEKALATSATEVVKSSHEWSEDCAKNPILTVRDSSGLRFAVVSRLPGELGMNGGYLGFTAKAPETAGVMAAIGAVTKDDISGTMLMVIGGGLLVVILIGIVLLIFEVDRPLKGLAADALRLAESEDAEGQLAEESHKGTFGSIARSVNLHIEKLRRTRESSSKSLDQLLGGGPMPAAGGGVSPAPPKPPPSDFQFEAPPASAPSDYDLGVPSGAPPADAPLFETEQTILKSRNRPAETIPPVAKPAAPPSMPPRPPTAPPPAPPVPSAAPPAIGRADSITDDILGDDATAALSPAPGGQNPEYRRVYDEFVALRHRLGDGGGAPSFEKFSQKLARNESMLKQKHNCDTIKFTVYEKAGKAALKASPVK